MDAAEAAGKTKQRYEQVNEAMFGRPLPPSNRLRAGLIVHSVGPAEGGWYVQSLAVAR
jgi:hypothetical protein